MPSSPEIHNATQRGLVTPRNAHVLAERAVRWKEALLAALPDRLSQQMLH